MYVTDAGIFGLHNYGGDNADQWKDRADAFCRFIEGHKHKSSVGKAMYGTCFATTHAATQRGYGTTNQKQNRLGELVEFAKNLKFNGQIYGYNLANIGLQPPIFVCYEKIYDKCVIQVKTWDKAHDQEGPNLSPDDYKMIGRNPNGIGYALKPTKQNVVTSVTITGQRTVYPEKLR